MPTRAANDGAHVEIVGETLRILRDLRGLRQNRLADLSGVSRSRIAGLETGRSPRTPRDVAEAVAASLHVPIGLLLVGYPPPPKRTVLHFRSRRKVAVRTLDGMLARASSFAYFTRHLRHHVRFPAVRIPTTRATTLDEIETAAERTRSDWGLSPYSPIHNVTRLLERAGILVGTFTAESTRVDAFSWIDRSRPLLLRSRDVQSASRARFSLLHEAGHLVLHGNRATGDTETERQADRFAGALLLPRRPFFQEFPRMKRNLRWAELLALKQRWGASIPAILARAHDLGLVDKALYRRGHIRISQMGWRTSEPYEPPDEPIELLQNVLDRLSPAVVLDSMRWLPGLLEEIVGIRFSPLPANVVEFPQRRE
jgi:Zn-dependent peptidase ImmA (M78 family)/transcriptional regulator with XRE-family HTH domain